MKSSALVLMLSTLVAAWPNAIETARPGAIVARQDTQSQATGSASQQPSGSASVTASAAQSSASGGNNNNNNENSSGDNNNSNSESSGSLTGGSGTISGSAAKSSGGSASATGGNGRGQNATKPVDPRLPPGGVAMITPAAIDGMTFLAVGQQATFVWNYTSLSYTPNYIDVVATNTINSQTYTIAANQSTEQTQSVVWDTGEFTKTTDLPFVVATYTLMIYDAETDPTSAPKAGYLANFNNLQFGIYTPQPYVPLNEFRCSTCKLNGALSMHEKQALGVILGTCAVTIFSFTWFASGVFGLI